MKITEFTDLIVWQKAHRLVLLIYDATNGFPKTESYGLCSQMRRASTSISSNIAEGFSRKTKNDKIHFYRISLGSLIELQNQLFISKDVKYLDTDKFNRIFEQTTEVKRLILGSMKTCVDFK